MEDLKKIKTSIIGNLDGKDVAVRLLRKLIDKIDVLTDFPYMGEKVRKLLDINHDCRCLFCNPDYAFYRVEEEYIRIVAVVNEKQDFYPNSFGKQKMMKRWELFLSLFYTQILKDEYGW